MNQTPDQLQADLMAFPVLSAAELEQCTEFGTRCSFASGEELFGAGSQSFDCYVIVSGDVCIMDVSTDEPTCIVRYGAGQFTGDIDLFTGRRAVGSCQAATVVEAIRIAPDRVREMLVRQPTLGARILARFSAQTRVADDNGFPGDACVRRQGRQTDSGIESPERAEHLECHWVDSAPFRNALEPPHSSGPTSSSH